MKNFKVFYKAISLFTSGMLVVCFVGCSNKKVNLENGGNTQSSSSSFVNEESVTTNTTSSTKGSTVTENTTTKSSTTTSTFTENDIVVLNHFKELGDDINNSINSDELLDKGKSYFVYAVDFLFYDGEIKGIKFSDLSDRAKEQLLGDVVNIDELICSKYPNYKENIVSGGSSVYNKASDIIRAGGNNIKDFSRDKLGDDNYNKLLEYNSMFWKQCGDDWNDFKSIVGEGSSYVKDKVSDWYQSKFKD